MARPRRDVFPCPNCGEDVPAGARSCPECGSDDETGWSEDTLYDGLDLPDPGQASEEPPPSKAAWIRIVALLVLVVIALLVLSRVW